MQNANIGYLKNFMETWVETYGKDRTTKRWLCRNAVDILRDHLPKYASPYDEEVYLQKLRMQCRKAPSFDSGSVLREHKNIQLYYRTDHPTGPLEAAYMCMRHGQKKRDFLRLHRLIIKRRRSQMDSSARLMQGRRTQPQRYDPCLYSEEKEKYQVNYVAKNESGR